MLIFNKKVKSKTQQQDQSCHPSCVKLSSTMSQTWLRMKSSRSFACVDKSEHKPSFVTARIPRVPTHSWKDDLKTVNCSLPK